VTGGSRITTDENRALVRRFLSEAWNARRLDLVDQLVDEAYAVGGVGHGPAAVRRNMLDFQFGFPDMRWEIEDVIADGDLVAARITLHGTHLGRFHGIDATGRAVRMQEMCIWRLENGKLREAWFTFDGLGLRRQLGTLGPHAPGPDEA
jgi:predicted ester cyclase